jgi:hypothetical protein
MCKVMIGMFPTHHSVPEDHHLSLEYCNSTRPVVDDSADWRNMDAE